MSMALHEKAEPFRVGDIVELTSKIGMAAQAGALARVESLDDKYLGCPPMLILHWLPNTGAGIQMDGDYFPSMLPLSQN